MSRRRYLYAYDVADDKRRTRVYGTLVDFGDHVQYSVFICDLTARERVELDGRLSEAIHHREDQVLAVDLGPADRDLIDVLSIIGKAFSPSSRAMIV
jgi:CRISPR-associated protein Cas2